MSAQRALRQAQKIPIYTIDLSLPPRERYKHVASDFKAHIKDLIGLFDELVQDVSPKLSTQKVASVARLFLRGVYSKEQTEELRGISDVTGVEMFLLVAFNTLLDCFMGCTSAGVRVADTAGGPSRMMHLRTLDWGMDPLRRVVVQLNFVREPGGSAIARSISYVGYVGVLTGVRHNLSLSINFRPNHNNSDSLLANFRYYMHQVLVVLGVRSSISSDLRQYLLEEQRHSSTDTSNDDKSALLEDMKAKFPLSKTTAVYVVASDGQETCVFEKDRVTAVKRTSAEMAIATNHDADEESKPKVQKKMEAGEQKHIASEPLVTNIKEEIVAESMNRKKCLERRWRRAQTTARRKQQGCTNTGEFAVSETQARNFVLAWPTTNEMTHYAVVMDPAKGDIAFARKWDTSLTAPDEDDDIAGNEK